MLSGWLVPPEKLYPKKNLEKEEEENNKCLSLAECQATEGSGRAPRVLLTAMSRGQDCLWFKTLAKTATPLPVLTSRRVSSFERVHGGGCFGTATAAMPDLLAAGIGVSINYREARMEYNTSLLPALASLVAHSLPAAALNGRITRDDLECSAVL